MKTKRLWLLACAPLALAACGVSDTSKGKREAGTNAPPTDTIGRVVPLQPDSVPRDSTTRDSMTAVSLAARAAGLRLEGDEDRLVGRLVLKQRDAAGNTLVETYDRFQVNIVRYLANWELAGTAFSQTGKVATFSLALDEKANLVVLGVDRRIWSIPTEEGSIRVINAHREAQLSVRFVRDAFSSNEPSWRIGLESVLFAADT